MGCLTAKCDLLENDKTVRLGYDFLLKQTAFHCANAYESLHGEDGVYWCRKTRELCPIAQNLSGQLYALSKSPRRKREPAQQPQK